MFNSWKTSENALKVNAFLKRPTKVTAKVKNIQILSYYSVLNALSEKCNINEVLIKNFSVNRRES